MADGGDAATELPAVLESAGDKPRALHRFIHAGPELRSLDAPNAVLATLRRKDVPPARSWRAFTDSEDARLAQAWDQLEHDRAGEPQVAGEPRFVQEPEQLALDDDDGAAHVVPVGLDQLFSVDLRAMTLEPAFWRGQGVRVRRALWFYPPASAGDRTTAMPVYPVDDELADALERAYDYIKPWSASYDAELHSALELGASAQARVKVALDTHAEADAPSMDVIFESDNSGRIYSGILGTVGKSFFTSATGLGGGQLVLRGWDAVRDHAEARRPRERQRSQSVDTDAVKAEPAQEGGGFLAALRARLNRAGSPAPDHEVRNETSEAMDTGRNNAETQDDIGDVDELVLIVHGIGQQLASTHEGFSFVHAVNRFRAISTDLSTSSSSTLTPLLGRKRAQFIPVMWRTDLDFDEPASDRDDTAEERLENSFSLRDIEVQGSIPLLRQVVSGLVLDVPFYLSRHRPKMVRALVTKANGIYRRWCARHPGFAEKGRVSIIAHSLGSVLCADVLSAQPTLVKPFDDMTIDERRAEHSFVFDTRIMFLAGSPLSFFVHLNQGQLIARKGRAHTRHAAPDIALDRAGRYGCMAVESVYNTYYVTDPVAFTMNACVDRDYSKLIEPVLIPSINETLTESLRSTIGRLSKLFGGLWGGEETATPPPKPDAPSSRPSLKRLPSEMPQHDKAAIVRAEERFKALNPQGCIDFYLPSSSLNEYIDALTSHGGYWEDPRFATFVLTQLFADHELLARAGREHLGKE